MKRYHVIKLIGRGNYGTAHLVRKKDTGQTLVVKQIPLIALQEKERREAETECKLLATLDHPNILEYVDSFVEDETLHIVTQYCEYGDLAKIIKTAKKAKNGEQIAYFQEDQILEWFIQIAMAVEHIHSRRILHRDLKTGNVFITKNNVVKLGDFGIAKVLDSTLEQANSVVGTPFYMSPEVCESKAYDFKSDLWAMGCILYELCTLNHAFDASNLLGLVFKIVQENYPPIPDHYSDDLKNLVKQLLYKDPSKRPSCRKIFRMPFIKRRLERLAEAVSLGQTPTSVEKSRPKRAFDTVERNNSSTDSKSSVQEEQLSSNFPNLGNTQPLTPTAAELRNERKLAAIRKQEELIRQATADGAKERLEARRRSTQMFMPSADNLLCGTPNSGLKDNHASTQWEQKHSKTPPPPPGSTNPAFQKRNRYASEPNVALSSEYVHESKTEVDKSDPNAESLQYTFDWEQSQASVLKQFKIKTDDSKTISENGKTYRIVEKEPRSKESKFAESSDQSKSKAPYRQNNTSERWRHRYKNGVSRSHKTSSTGNAVVSGSHNHKTESAPDRHTEHMKTEKSDNSKQLYYNQHMHSNTVTNYGWKYNEKRAAIEEPIGSQEKYGRSERTRYDKQKLGKAQSGAKWCHVTQEKHRRHTEPTIPYDEIPIQASGRYDISEIDEHVLSKSRIKSENQNFRSDSNFKAIRNCKETADDYSDDFESDESESLDENNELPLTPRGREMAELKRRTDEKDAKRVLDECRRRTSEDGNDDNTQTSLINSSIPALGIPKLTQSQLRSEKSGNANVAHSVDWKLISDKQRLELERILGEEKFRNVYNLLKNVHGNSKTRSSQPRNQKNLRQQLARIVGKEYLNVCGDVDQLIYIEEMKLKR